MRARICRHRIAHAVAALAVAIAGAFGGIPGAQAQSTQRIAAIVNDDIISSQDLDSRLRIVLASSGLANTAEAQRRLLPQVLQTYIDDQLKLQEAERLNIEINQAEIDGAFANLARSNNASVPQLEQFLVQNGIDLGVLREQLRAQIVWGRIVNSRLLPRVVVTEEQIDFAMRARENATDEELLLSEILLPVYSPEIENEVLQTAIDIRNEVDSAATFAQLAQQFSAASTAQNGGNLGWVPASILVEGMRDQILPLGEGEVSQPIRTQAGVHLFMVQDRRVVSRATAATRVDLAQLVFPLPESGTEADVEGALAAASNVRRGLDSCDDVATAAEQLGSSDGGRLGWQNLDDLTPLVARYAREAPVSQLSDPIRAPSGIYLVMVCARDAQGGAEGQRAEVQARLQNESLERLAGRYLRDLRKDAFIDIRVRV